MLFAMNTQRGPRAVILLACIALALTACSSSSGKSGSGSSPTQGSGSSGSKSTIKVGFVGSFTGSQSSSTGGGPKIISAWEKTINAAGGIDGHPVNVIVADDALVASKSVAAVKSLIENDKVVAIVDTSTLDGAWAKYAESKGVPVIGQSFTTEWITNPDFYSSATNIFALIYGAVTLSKSNGTDLAYYYCSESPACASSVPLIDNIAKTVGVSVKAKGPVSASATNYTSTCQQIKDTQVQTVFIAAASGVVKRIMDACKTQGITPKIVAQDGTVSPTWKGDDALEGMQASQGVGPWFDSNTPALKQYRDAVKEYASDLGDLDSADTLQAWVPLQAFAAAVKAQPAETVTADTVKTGLFSFKAETLGGIAPPMTFTKDKVTPTNCYFTIKLEGGQFVAGLKTTQCAPDALINGIASSLPK